MVSGPAVFDNGDRVPASGPPPLLDDASVLEVRRREFQVLCLTNKIALPDPSGRDVRLVPRLVEWERDGNLERYTVYVPGGLLDSQVDNGNLEKSLVTARPGARSVQSARLDEPGWVRFVLNFNQLAAVEPWRDEYLPADPWRVSLGKLQAGPHAIWDLDSAPHALFCGKSGGGKTGVARVAAAQLAAHGGLGAMCSPNRSDGNLVIFDEVDGWEFTGGRDEEGLGRIAEQAGRVIEVMRHREGDMDGLVYGGPWFTWWLDELATLVTPTDADSDAMKRYRKQVFDAFDLVMREGRKFRVGAEMLVQQPRANLLGGSQQLMDNIGLRLAVKYLDPNFQSIVFPKDTAGSADAVKRVLSSGATPPGRGIVMGVEQPGLEDYGDVDRSPVQCWWAEPEDTRRMLGLDVIEVEGWRVGDVPEIGDGPDLGADTDTDGPVGLGGGVSVEEIRRINAGPSGAVLTLAPPPDEDEDPVEDELPPAAETVRPPRVYPARSGRTVPASVAVPVMLVVVAVWAVVIAGMVAGAAGAAAVGVLLAGWCAVLAGPAVYGRARQSKGPGPMVAVALVAAAGAAMLVFNVVKVAS